MNRLKLLALSSVVLAAGCNYVSAQSGASGSKSTATITQSGPGGTTSVTRSGGNQTITRKSGGNSATISQGSSVPFSSGSVDIGAAIPDADDAAAALEDCRPAKPEAGAKAETDTKADADAKADAHAKATDCPPDVAAGSSGDRDAGAKDQNSQRAEAPGRKSDFERRIERQTGIEIAPSPEFRELFLNKLD